MKAVILAAGKGEELAPLTNKRNKTMIPIVGKPILERVLHNVIDNGFKDIILVINKDDEEIKSYFGTGTQYNIKITYVYQAYPGLEGAIRSVHSHVENENHFLLVHGDIIADKALIQRVLNSYGNLGADMALAAALKGEVQDFGVVSVSSDGLVMNVYPTGDASHGNYVVAGVFLLTPEIYTYLNQGNKFNESFNEFLKRGGKVAVGMWPEPWFDIGRPWDLIKATRYLLNQLVTSQIHQNVDTSNATIKGPVIIEDGVVIKEGATIRGPVYIGKNTYIGNNALVRDYSSIEQDSLVGMGVEVKNSVLLEATKIHRLSYVGDSVLGRNVTLDSGVMTVNMHVPYRPIVMTVKGEKRTVDMKKMGCVIGDNARIGVKTTIMPGIVIGSDAVLHPNCLIETDIPDRAVVTTKIEQSIQIKNKE